MPVIIARTTVTQLWCAVIEHVLHAGVPSAPRDRRTLEVLGPTLVLETPAFNLLDHSVRRPKLGFAIAEWLWIATGQQDVERIATFNPLLRQFSDDGRRLTGAYGPRLMPQWGHLVETLRHDPSSRQAVATIWTPNPAPSKDIPCTVSVQALVRDQRLLWFTTMRSNDAWLGLPYDVFVFTQLQRMLAAQLGVMVGAYHHMVGSLHLYEQHFAKAQQVAAAPDNMGLMDRATPEPGATLPPHLWAYIDGLALEKPVLDLLTAWPWLMPYLSVLKFHHTRQRADLLPPFVHWPCHGYGPSPEVP